jgi:dTDP-4-dehydrorhamnose reductase
MRIVLTGASGRLGSALLDLLVGSGHSVHAWSGSERGERSGVRFIPIELMSACDVAAALDAAEPDLVIHTAAVSKPDLVRRDPQRGWAVNSEATARIAGWSARTGRRMILTSTDLVFDGLRGLYREDESPCPAVEYGRTKAAAEAAVRACPGGLVARVALLYGPTPNGRASFFDTSVAALREGRPVQFFADEYRTPLDYRTAAGCLAALAETGATGTVHVAGFERLTRLELMMRVAAALHLDLDLVRPSRLADAAGPEPRPADVSLDTSRLARVLPDFVRPTIERVSAGWSQ